MHFSKTVRYFLGGILGFILYAFGIVHKAKKKALKSDCVTGIVFHNPGKKLFNKSINWLNRNNFKFISTQELIDYLKGEHCIPRGSIWLSLDDGWKDNIQNVIPKIQKENIPIIIFITTGPVRHNSSFWWDFAEENRNLLQKNNNLEKKDLYFISEKNRRKIINSLLNIQGVKNKCNAMSIKDVSKIASNPHISIGAHTVNHPILINCTNNEIEYEINMSKKHIEEWIKEKVKTFAYPNGCFNGREKTILKDLGFDLAATCENKIINKQVDIYKIPRFVAMDKGLLIENICHMMGIWEPIINKLKDFFNYK